MTVVLLRKATILNFLVSVFIFFDPLKLKWSSRNVKIFVSKRMTEDLYSKDSKVVLMYIIFDLRFF